MDSLKLDSMVSFIEEFGGCVDWCVFTTNSPNVKAKRLRKFFQFRQCGKSLEVSINETVRGITHVECTNQAEEKIVQIPIPYGSKVIVPAILSSFSADATEFVVV